MAGILLTGGSGRLGRELCSLLVDVAAPPKDELDVRDPASIAAALDRYRPELVVHAAAYTDVAGAERERQPAWETNVVGTGNLVRAVGERGLPLVHISTDYVFWGDRGNYREEDPPGPVRNYYALTKLCAEAAVRVLARHLVIRTSFRAREWPYPVAYQDLYTSQDYLDRVAPELSLAIGRFQDIPYDTLHIGGPRRSALELARERAPEVRAGSRRQAGVDLPADISLNTRRWNELRASWMKS